MIVSKFGGTSMGDATCMLRSAEVVKGQGSALVVVSATSGTTNAILEMGRLAEQGDWAQAESLHAKSLARHLDIARELQSLPNEVEQLQNLFSELHSMLKGIYLLRDCSVKALDAIVSIGERSSSVLFTQAMRKSLGAARKVAWFDVREVLATDSQFTKARPQIEKIRELCLAKLVPLLKDTVVVTQGFIGRTEEGFTTTLGRGGSDYSAALLAEGIRATILEIWTDVEGIATTDPRICKEARSISEISFKEASELAVFGAKVLHPATLQPAMRQSIPTFVGSSFNPKGGGTWVKAEAEKHPLVRALALRKKQVLVTLSTPEMLYAHGFLAKIFNAFDAHKVSVDAITTSEISVSLTLDDSTLLNKKLIEDLEKFCEVHVEQGLSIVSLIGNNINHTSGLAQKIFDAISDINVRMICSGASKHNFCILVDEAHGEETIRRLHKELIHEV